MRSGENVTASCSSRAASPRPDAWRNVGRTSESVLLLIPIGNQQEQPQRRGRQEEAHRPLGQDPQPEEAANRNVRKPRLRQVANPHSRIAARFSRSALPGGKEQHYERGNKRQRRVNRCGPRRDGVKMMFEATTETGPKSDFRGKQPPRPNDRSPGRRPDRQEQPPASARAANSLTPSRLETAHHQPEHQRRLLGKEMAVEHGHDPIAASRHFAGDRRVQGLVEVPQPGRAPGWRKTSPPRPR